MPKFLDDWVDPWREYLAEFLGTLILVFVASSVVIASTLYGEIGIVGEAVAIGLVYISMLFATVNLSGGFLNPAVTLSLWLCQRMTGTRAAFFVILQILASLAASALVFLIFGPRAGQFAFGMSALGVGISAETAIALEAILTASLVFVVFSTTVDSRGPVSFGPLAIGTLSASFIFVFGSLTGGVANISRLVGPAVFANSYSNLFIYVIGGLVGSLFGLVYELVFLRKSRKK